MSDYSSIYLLLDSSSYEGSTPLHAFKYKESAECMKAMAEEYDKKKPIYPDCVEDNEECEEQWEKYNKADKQWRDNHPIKNGFIGADFYTIEEVPYHTGQ